MTLLMLWLTTFAVCVVGAVIPLVNTEIYLLSVSALSPAEAIPPLVLAATVGQMTGKVGMYFAGKGLIRIGGERLGARVNVVKERLESKPRIAKLTLFSSATLGLPPLYVVSVACGTIGMGLFSFIVIGFLGRLIHFSFVAWVPQYAKLLIG